MPNTPLPTDMSGSSCSFDLTTLTHLLQAVFGQRWVAQQGFTSTAELDALHAALQVRPDMHVLDIGHGPGGPAIYLAQQYGCRVTSIENSFERVQLARAAVKEARLTHYVEVLTDDMLMSGFPNYTFDAIVSHHAWLTVANKQHLFEICQRWLRPGGRLAASLIVRLGQLPPPQQLIAIAGPIPTVSDYLAYAAQAGLCVLALKDASRSFREVCAHWRGALVVWNLMCFSHLSPEIIALAPSTIAQVAEWASQGVVGQVRLLIERERRSL